MSNGESFIILSESTSWSDFPRLIASILPIIQGEIGDKADTVDLRMWKVKTPQGVINAVYQDFPNEITLEPVAGGDSAIEWTFEILRESVGRDR